MSNIELKEIISKAGDGCHKYGWILNIIVTLVTLAYFMGGLTNSVTTMQADIDEVKSRLGRLEAVVLYNRK